MKNPSPHLGSRILRAGLGVAVALAAIAATQPAAAHAVRRHAKTHHTVIYAYPVHEIRYVERSFTVPRHISRRSFVSYRPYYQGAIWHRGHGHSHSVYLFPVRRGHTIRHRPHSYCSGSLFEIGVSTGRGHFAFRHGH